MDLEDAVAILKVEVRDKCSAYADRALAEVLSLVEEKLTTTNKQSTPCSYCGSKSAIQFSVCLVCRGRMSLLDD